MNQKKLKQLRKIVSYINAADLQRPYTSTTIPAMTGPIHAQIPMTATYPKASRRRVYQDAKKALTQAASHPVLTIRNIFLKTPMEAIVHAVI